MYGWGWKEIKGNISATRDWRREHGRGVFDGSGFGMMGMMVVPNGGTSVVSLRINPIVRHGLRQKVIIIMPKPMVVLTLGWSGHGWDSS